MKSIKQYTRRRVKERRQQEMKMDKLSNLPDALILLILSFLDTKNAVQTSVLSKRWNNLWTHVSGLNFNSESFPTMESFQRFVRKVLSLRIPSINLSSLNFHCGLTMDYKSLENSLKIFDGSYLHRTIRFDERPPVDESFIDEVIMNAISHGVQQMDISLCDRSGICLTPDLFTCGSLKTLRLQDCQINKTLHNSNYALLTTLHLYKVKFWSENDYLNLFSSCVNLENLILLECCVSFMGVFIIYSPHLVNLTISDMDYGWVCKQCKVMVSAPRLTSFNYKGFYPIVLSRDQCPVLDRVNIYVSKSHTSRSWLVNDVSEDVVVEEYISDWRDMFEGVSHAKQSKIDGNIFKFRRGICAILSME